MSGHKSSENSVTSTSLLDRLQTQDQDAWRRLLKIYGPVVDAWLRQARLQPASVEDCFQEVFRSVATHVDRFRRERTGSFRTWLRTITANKVADHWKNHARQPIAEGGTEALEHLANCVSPEHTGEPPDEEQELRVIRLRALELVRAEFEPKTWQMFWQVVVEGRATADVASDHGVGAAAVRMAKGRVLARLRAELSDLEPEIV
jgi:RNA polymerase sigma-70 factor (ECF subfamily)